MIKNGIIKEKFRKVIFAGVVKIYKIFYKKYEKTRESILPKYIKETNNFQMIPVSRISKEKKNHRILFEKNSKGIE